MTIKIDADLDIHSVSLNELKQIAKAQGYYLKPITKYNKMVTCKCGCNRHKRLDILGGRTLFQCSNCGFKGMSGYGLQQARDGWNKAIQNYELLKELQDKEDNNGR